MKHYANFLLFLLLVSVIFFAACKKEEKTMVDINTINADGSHNESYIFREEIEKEKQRELKRSDPDFR
ncbi:MAG TPA: hypothetical protein PK986_10110 [Spirochaetota bacterium]|nr:hypothetical protein [Spirochaetota bacterium]HQO40811.1 hypothetical protein [Spirochaetota bacterium]